MLKRLQKYVNEIVLSLVIIMVSGIIFYLGHKMNFDGSSLEDLSELVFDSLIGLVAIWISAYFILIQLYKNTYPMEIIEKTFLKKVKLILLFSVFNIFMGLLILTIFTDLVSRSYFLIIFIINIIIIFYNTYMINRNFTINTYIDKYFNDLEDDLEKNSLIKSKIDQIFNDIYKLFDECVIKEEYYVCNNIADKNSRLFQKLIEHCNKLLVSDETEKKELANYIFNKIISAGIYQIKNIRVIENKSLMSELFEQQENNIKLCLRINNLEWFKKYLRKINLLAKDYQNKEVLEAIYFMNRNIGEYLLDKDEIYFEWFIKEIYALNISLKYAYNNINLKYFCKLFMSLLISDNEEFESKKYNILKDVLEQFTKEITYLDSEIEDMVIYYQLYGNQILESKNKEQAENFIKIITDNNNRLTDIERWNGFILYYLNISMEKWYDLGKDNRKIIINMVLDLVLKDSKNNYFSFLPKYKDIIFEKRYDTNVIDDICEEVRELLIRLIINNNISMFYYVLEEVKKSILNLNQSDRGIQEKLFSVCIDTLSRTINIENKKFIELTIVTIDDIIDELDKNRKISDKFGKNIIEKLSDMVIYRARINENDAIKLIYLISGFLEEDKEYNFVKDNTKKQLLYKNIYNIGISCIENNKENAVRTVSNTLGWYIIRSIDNDTKQSTDYLIDRTIDLFRIAQNMQISEKTLVFIMTLFTTVGTYCCKSERYRLYLNKILKILKYEEFSRIKTAIELRTNENTMWDKLYDGKTKELTRKFLNELKNMHITA